MPANRMTSLLYWRLEGVGNRSEPGQHQVLHHHRDADGGDQRQQLIPFAAQGREDRRVDQPAERGADDEGDGDAQDVAAADQMHEKIGGEGPERDKVGVREIDLHEHAVDQRQA